CMVTPVLDSPFGLVWTPQNSCILSYSTRKGPRTLGPCGGVRKQEGGGHDTRCPAEESREHSRGGAAVSPAPYQPAPQRQPSTARRQLCRCAVWVPPPGAARAPAGPCSLWCGGLPACRGRSHP